MAKSLIRHIKAGQIRPGDLLYTKRKVLRAVMDVKYKFGTSLAKRGKIQLVLSETTIELSDGKKVKVCRYVK